jgi:hypothetical protein
MIDEIVNQFIERCAETKEACIIDAMARGIDLHVMKIDEIVTTELTEDNCVKFNFRCKVSRI